MILLSSDYLIFQLSSGESVPFSASSICVELVGSIGDSLAPEIVHHATAAVFHYYKHELRRESLTVAEFASALQKVLKGFGFDIEPADAPETPAALAGEDLNQLVLEDGGELLFYAQLRDALRRQLDQSPRFVRFHGLRGCVKRLAGARRWSPRCNQLRDQIVDYLRGCLTAEEEPADCVLVVK